MHSFKKTLELENASREQEQTLMRLDQISKVLSKKKRK